VTLFAVTAKTDFTSDFVPL